MGHSELQCHICGVSFNVSRYPTMEEVFAGIQSRPWLQGAVHRFTNKYECRRGGCQVIDRTRAESEFADDSRRDDLKNFDWGSDRLHDDDMEDASYQIELEPESRQEGYEHELHEAGTPDESEEEEPIAQVTETEAHPADTATDSSSDSDLLYQDFIDSSPPERPGPYRFWGNHMRPICDNAASEDDARWLEYQHVSGQDCLNRGAYSGHLLSAEEARGSCTLQALVPRSVSTNFAPEQHDEPFEKTGAFFLSGLCDSVPSRDDRWPDVYPPRHNTFTVMTDNYLISDELTPMVAVPFHPTCLEIFKRVCIHRSGEVDMQALTDWFSHDAALDIVDYEFPRDEPVVMGSVQWWDHWPGDQHLAANPCFIPTLASYFDKAMARGSALTSPNEAAVPVGDYNRTSTGNDFFSKLPLEIRLEILRLVDANDVASLRLASPAFRVLPQYFFRHLLLKEYPWVYESWCSQPYPHWAINEAWELRKIDEDWRRKGEDKDAVIAILKEEATPESDNQDAIAAVEESFKQQEAEFANVFHPQPATQLPIARTDWYRLFCDVAKNRHRINGLRNRERIWKDCNEILNRVYKYRASGRVGPDMTDAQRRLRTLGEWQERDRQRRRFRDGFLNTNTDD